MKTKLIELANQIAKRNFMNYPDYDQDNPIRDLAGALTILIGESLPHDSSIESQEVFDYLEKQLS